MPIRNFEGDTFVAFLDLCGFKELMRNEDKAWRALDSLYQTGYEVLRESHDQHRIEGIFVSDSGVLFVRGNERPQDITLEIDLQSLLIDVKKINKAMLNVNLLATSIAYGKFKYQERIEFVGIEKNPIYGNAYASAYFDNAVGSPRIQPGQCRLVKRGLPPTFNELNFSDEYRGLIRERPGDTGHYYYYWNVDRSLDVEAFEDRYTDAYNLKYQGMLRALKGGI
jgi:hypothetical protein